MNLEDLMSFRLELLFLGNIFSNGCPSFMKIHTQFFIAKLSPSPSFSSAELAVFSFSPTHPRESKELAAIGDQITLLEYRTQIGRWPTNFVKWKTTPILCKMEDDLNVFFDWRPPQFLTR